MVLSNELQHVSLESIGDGVAVEKFQEELNRVVNNILDPNTDPEAMREITVKVKIKPDEDRESCSVAIGCVAKLAPRVDRSTRMFVGREGREAVAMERVPAPIIPGLEGKVVSMERKEEP